jgi:hypothetical protein
MPVEAGKPSPHDWFTYTILHGDDTSRESTQFQVTISTLRKMINDVVPLNRAIAYLPVHVSERNYQHRIPCYARRLINFSGHSSGVFSVLKYILWRPAVSIDTSDSPNIPAQHPQLRGLTIAFV